MKTIYIYCEGPTEESFINTVLYPYFFALGIYVRPIVCETRRDANRKYRGGVSRYAKIKSELMILCKSHPHEYVTTMFDYYAMPSDTPGIEALIPGYAKIKNGTQLSDAMGIHTIMKQCPHFKRWIQDMAAW